MKDILSPSIPAVEDLFSRTVIQPVSILLTAGFLLAAGPACADGAFRTGLEVAALNGMPGVLSARWSGTHGDDAANTALLLAQLRDVPTFSTRTLPLRCRSHIPDPKPSIPDP